MKPKKSFDKIPRRAQVALTAWADGTVYSIDICDRVIAGQTLGAGQERMRLDLDEKQLLKVVRELGYVVRRARRSGKFR